MQKERDGEERKQNAAFHLTFDLGIIACAIYLCFILKVKNQLDCTNWSGYLGLGKPAEQFIILLIDQGLYKVKEKNNLFPDWD